MTSEDVEYRKLIYTAAGFYVNVPRKWLSVIGIQKGDYIKMIRDGRRIIIEPAE